MKVLFTKKTRLDTVYNYKYAVKNMYFILNCFPFKEKPNISYTLFSFFLLEKKIDRSVLDAAQFEMLKFCATVFFYKG